MRGKMPKRILSVSLSVIMLTIVLFSAIPAVGAASIPANPITYATTVLRDSMVDVSTTSTPSNYQDIGAPYGFYYVFRPDVNGNYIEFELKVDIPGNYQINVEGLSNNNRGKADLILPDKGNMKLGDTFDLSLGNINVVHDINFGSVYLDAGTVKIRIVSAGEGDNATAGSKRVFPIRSITLTPQNITTYPILDLDRRTSAGVAVTEAAAAVLQGGGYVVANPPNRDDYIEFDIDVEEAGKYLISSQLYMHGNSGSFKVILPGMDNIQLGEDENEHYMTSGYTDPNNANRIKLISFGQIELQPGIHTIRFVSVNPTPGNYGTDTASRRIRVANIMLSYLSPLSPSDTNIIKSDDVDKTADSIITGNIEEAWTVTIPTGTVSIDLYDGQEQDIGTVTLSKANLYYGASISVTAAGSDMLTLDTDGIDELGAYEISKGSDLTLAVGDVGPKPVAITLDGATVLAAATADPGTYGDVITFTVAYVPAP